MDIEKKSSTCELSHFNDRLCIVELSHISLNPYQPRKIFERNELEELAQSIQSIGLIHPPLVRRLYRNHYELIAGERRFQACKVINLKKIPVYVRTSNDKITAQIALIENIQRVDLNPIEIARALKQMIEEFHLSQEELSLRIGKKRSTVANYLRLLALPSHIQESVLLSHISMGHAKVILSLETVEKQELLHTLILRDKLNVREAENAVIKINEKSKDKAVPKKEDFFLRALTEKIEHRLGTKVSIQSHGQKGQIIIDYYDLDDLDRLIGVLT